MANTKPDGSALLVIDVQNDVVADAYHRDEVVATIADLVTRARAAGTPVVWVQHSDDGMTEGSDGWQIVPELQPTEGEAVVHKKFGDSFAGTDLAEVLAAAGAGRLIVTGAQTDACIRSTLHGGLTRGYDMTLVSDAHTTEDMRQWGSPIGPKEAIEYTNLYWSFSKTPDATGSVVAAADLDF
ncbi:nicotinamidase-related amidase [Branchiibius hedensis]|uniref:Nicotinamidase-related amidase n=1 Tax=Branchiibius hedensis TaxID=672460 RepID=A0A2Y8ZMB3_9MICO|nr:cysteine hydrolase family protein [Branchiibius hedensis]PWJ24258.1 nicotinamidase-related amidase [Branchiibius hedensis]SSA33075.1 Nicotinamidase-related amidase [Branchiibius hedensis]